ncbi:MAG: DMT family transporter, partial [Oscillospiraceae bacterium]|nr:DMT family transporter [Oscillospiraceae bacterium]
MNTAYPKQLGALLLFGMNGIVASYISMNSYEIVLSRTLIGCLFLLLLFLPQKRKFTFLKHKKPLALVLASGAAMGCSWMFLYEAYAQAGVSVATLLYYCGPVLVLAFAPAVLHEKLSPARACGIGAALGGMVLLNLDKFMLNGFSWGFACGLLSALLYAVMVLFNKKAQGISGYESALL